MPPLRAIWIDPGSPDLLVLGEAPQPVPRPDEALVRVRAFSLNRGELRRARGATARALIGWDLAGVVDKPAADGSGPKAGQRVVGLLADGAWSELVAVPTRSLATIPESVSDAQAATLPVAGLTALHALRRAGAAVGRKLLITGASGGVGEFALPLARHGGCRVIAQLRREEQAAAARDAGAHEVVIGGDEKALATQAPYDGILESVGGATLGAALASLAPGGTCVTFGISGAGETTFDVTRFYRTGRATLYGFFLFRELDLEPATRGLATLLDLVARGVLKPRISREVPWTDVGRVAKDVYERRIAAKVVALVR
jgi:NADPH:quinone reductase-like Zn-dependent oxidoreductase